jgi:hypothetical protein
MRIITFAPPADPRVNGGLVHLLSLALSENEPLAWLDAAGEVYIYPKRLSLDEMNTITAEFNRVWRVSKTPTTHDAVHHPSHYTSHPSGVECIDIIEHFVTNIGNAVKYLWRAGMKDDLLQDLEKARWYVDREIGRVKAQRERAK